MVWECTFALRFKFENEVPPAQLHAKWSPAAIFHFCAQIIVSQKTGVLNTLLPLENVYHHLFIICLQVELKKMLPGYFFLKWVESQHFTFKSLVRNVTNFCRAKCNTLKCGYICTSSIWYKFFLFCFSVSSDVSFYFKRFIKSSLSNEYSCI